VYQILWRFILAGANVGKPIIGLPRCHRAWRAPCYRQRSGTSLLKYHRSDPETASSPSEEMMYLQARPGASIFCPFECYVCSFYRLTVTPRQLDNSTHQNLLDHIGRTNLDAFWSHSEDTLCNLTRMFLEEVATGRDLGFQMFLMPPRPFPTQGAASRYRGNDPDQPPWMASAFGGATSQVIRSDKGLQAIANAHANSEWNTCFIIGLRSRIGECRKQNAAISIALMVELQHRLEL
jgi:hypothetical protein